MDEPIPNLRCPGSNPHLAMEACWVSLGLATHAPSELSYNGGENDVSGFDPHWGERHGIDEVHK